MKPASGGGSQERRRIGARGAPKKCSEQPGARARLRELVATVLGTKGMSVEAGSSALWRCGGSAAVWHDCMGGASNNRE